MRLSLLLLLFTAAMPASPVVFEFTGTVTQVDPLLTGSFAPEQLLTGSFRFESTTADSSLNPETGVYFNAGNLFSVMVGALSYSATAIDIDITNSATVDIYRVVGSNASGPGAGAFTIDSLVFALTDNAAAPVTALSSDGLPVTPPVLSGFNVRTFTLAFRNGNTGASVVAKVDSLRLAVPEPALAAPLALVLVALLTRRRGQRVARGR